MQSHFHVKPNFGWIIVELRLSWGFDKIYFLLYFVNFNVILNHQYLETNTLIFTVLGA